jgi:PadR family transcriptional regulator, regulatory protein AphA
MTKASKSKYAVLGLLSMGPMSGYDIKKKVEATLRYFWNESYGQIYPILKRLVADGLATQSVEEQTGKPDRYVYTLTSQGRQELQQWLGEPAEPQVERIEILLKLSFGQQLSMPENIQQVEHFRESQQKLYQEVQDLEQQMRLDHSDNPNLPYWLTAISYGLHTKKALIQWCDETLTRLREIEHAEHQSL